MIDIKPADGVAKAAAPPPLGVPPGAVPVPWQMISGTPFLLDEHQRAVVSWRGGTLVVAAAAGSGKSTVLVERTLELLREGYVPESICLLVYNRDAAASLRERLGARGGASAQRVNVFTFHAWAYALLRHWYPADPRFAPGHILDTEGGPRSAKAASILIETLKLKDLRWREAVETADMAAEALIDPSTPADIPRFARMLGEDWPTNTLMPAAIAKAILPLQTFCAAWRRHKAKEGIISFADMLFEVGRVIQTQPDAPHVAHLRGMYRWVMVDEAQDSNPARFAIARCLGSAYPGHHAQARMMMVGDIRQAIYSFTGAEPTHLQELIAEDGVTFTTLPVNRRSTRRIVDWANEVAADQDWNVGGVSLPKPEAADGEPPQVWVQANPQQEAAEIIRDIERRVASGTPMGTHAVPTFCVLARTNAMLIDLECAFVARGVPARISGQPGGIWSSSIGTQLLAYLEAIHGVPTWALLDVANTPNRYAPRAEVVKVLQAAQARERAGGPANLHGALLGAPPKGVKRLGDDLHELAKQSWAEQCYGAARWLGLIEDEDEDDLEGGDQDRKDALRILAAVAAEHQSLQGIYAYRQAQARAEAAPAVLLSTIHKAKGLEYPVVYVAGVRTRKLPHDKCESEAEERRLLYVAITRAQEATIVTTGGTPSRFLVDLGWVDAPKDGAKDDLDVEGYL